MAKRPRSGTAAKKKANPKASPKGQPTRKTKQTTNKPESRFRVTFENAAVGIAHVSPDGSFRRVNRRLCEIVGYSREELLGLTFMDITHPDDLDADMDQAERLRTGQIDSYSMEKRYQRKDGGEVWVNLTASAGRDADRLAYFIAIIQDISDRKEAEEQIRDLSRFPQQNPYPVMRVDADGRLLYANDASRPLLETWGIKTGAFLPPPLVSDCRARMGEADIKEIEVHANGRDYALALVPFPDAGYLNLYGNDVTKANRARKRETAAAVKTTAAHTAIDTMNAMGEGVALCETDGRIRNVNPAFAALTDYDAERLIGKRIQELLPTIFDEGVETIQDRITRVQLKRTTTDPLDALTISTRHSVKKWVIPTLTMIHGPQGESVGLVLTLRDISPLVRTQQKLAKNEQRYRELVENANSIILRITPDRRITFFNEYAQAFFGYPADEILGANIIGTIVPKVDSDGHDLQKLTEEIVARPEEHGANDSEARCKDGRRVWVHWSNRAIRDAQGQVKEVLCVGTNITERKRLEREADAYRTRLRTLADRLTATEEEQRRRVATQIHDTVIQTLSLSNIRLGGVLAAVEEAGLSGQRKRIEGIRQLLDQGTKECRGLMDELVPSLLYEVGLHAALRDFAEKQGRIDDTIISVEGNGDAKHVDDALRGLLFQCARELIMNALKHAGQCEIHVGLSVSDESVQLQVKDTGRGFDPDELDGDHRDRTEGGFGLFNIRERLEGLGGRLEIESVPGSGTLATVVIPDGTGR